MRVPPRVRARRARGRLLVADELETLIEDLGTVHHAVRHHVDDLDRRCLLYTSRCV